MHSTVIHFKTLSIKYSGVWNYFYLEGNNIKYKIARKMMHQSNNNIND